MTEPRYWDISARAYLARLGDAEYAEFLQRRQPRKRDRYSPSEYHRELIEHLNAGDEETQHSPIFKAHQDSALARGGTE